MHTSELLTGEVGIGLACDLGTGGARLRLFALDSGEWLGTAASLPWATYADTAGEGAIVLFATEALRIIRHTLANLFRENAAIVNDPNQPLRIVSIGGHMHALALIEGISAEGEPQVFSPMHMWNSAAASSYAKRLSAELGYKVDRRLSIAHLLRQLEQPGCEHRNIRAITTMSGLLAYCLSGQNALGPCEFSGLGIIDPVTGELSTRALAALPVDFDHTCLPRLLLPHQPLGVVSTLGLRWLGAPLHWQNLDILICPPEGDQAMGRFGLCRGPEDMGLVLGSSLVLTQVRPKTAWGKPREDQTGTIDFFVDGLGNPMDMGLISAGLREFDGFIAQQQQTLGEEVFRALGERAEQNLHTCDETFIAHFSVRDPALGVHRPFSINETDTTDAAITWHNALNQIAASIAIRGEHMWGNQAPQQLILGGAAARDNYLAQRIADMTGVPVLRPDNADEAMLNGAKTQARAVFAYNKDHGKNSSYDELFSSLQIPQSGTRFAPNQTRRNSLERYRHKLQEAIKNHGSTPA